MESRAPPALAPLPEPAIACCRSRVQQSGDGREGACGMRLEPPGAVNRRPAPVAPPPPRVCGATSARPVAPPSRPSQAALGPALHAMTASCSVACSGCPVQLGLRRHAGIRVGGLSSSGTRRPPPTSPACSPPSGPRVAAPAKCCAVGLSACCSCHCSRDLAWPLAVLPQLAGGTRRQ